MRRVVLWACGVFENSWLSFFHDLVLLAACIAGIAGSSFLWIVFAAGTLSLSSPSDWDALIETAARIDAQYRELARMLWPHDLLRAIRFFARGCLVPLVFVVRMASSLFFAALAYAFGYVMALMWGLE